MNSSQPAELETENFKNIQKSTEKIKIIKLLLFILAIVIFLSWNIFTGKVNINQNSFFSSFEFELDYYYSEAIKTLIEMKEYLITFVISLVLLYFIMKSNLEWERKYLEDLAKREEEEENRNINSNFNLSNENNGEKLSDKKNN